MAAITILAEAIAIEIVCMSTTIDTRRQDWVN
jgi:hypothetical protein